MLPQRNGVEPGQPLDHLIELGNRAALTFDLGHIQRIHRRDARGEDPMHHPNPTTHTNARAEQRSAG